MRSDNLCTAGYDGWVEMNKEHANENRPAFSDYSFDYLCELHDGCMDCGDYGQANRLQAAISARPEYPAYVEECNKALRAVEAKYADKSDETEVPF